MRAHFADDAPTPGPSRPLRPRMHGVADLDMPKKTPDNQRVAGKSVEQRDANMRLLLAGMFSCLGWVLLGCDGLGLSDADPGSSRSRATVRVPPLSFAAETNRVTARADMKEAIDKADLGAIKSIVARSNPNDPIERVEISRRDLTDESWYYYYIDTRTVWKDTPLCYAIGKKNTSVVECLIALGADIGMATNSWSSNEVTLSCWGKHLGRPNKPERETNSSSSYYRRTGLHAAAQVGYPPTIEVLLAAGAKVNAPDSKGRTALHIASSSGDVTLMKTLLARGADVNSRDEDSATPAHLAASGKQYQAVQLLASSGAAVDRKDKEGRTPLDLLRKAGYGETEIASIRDLCDPVMGLRALKGEVTCDVFLIAVSNGAIAAQAKGSAAASELDRLAGALAAKLAKDAPDKGKSAAVLTLRNRSGSPAGAAACEELADKLTGSFAEAKRFEMRTRVDVKAILFEKDFQQAQLDSADVLKDPRIRPKIASVDYVVIGGVTVGSTANR